MSTYLVIGASSGIGLATTNQLANEGHEVYATFHKNSTNSELSNVHYSALNVLDENLNLDFLPETLDGIVYCPGNINLKPFARIKPDEFVADYQLQVVGAIKTIQAALPRLKNAAQSSIVLFSTVAVQGGFGFHSQVSTSKGAIEGLTKALAAEFAPKIRVNCIAPSLTDTPLASALLNTDAKREANAQRNPLQKIGSPSDIANIATFLLSSKASWITGQIMHVDGGMSTLKI